MLVAAAGVPSAPQRLASQLIDAQHVALSWAPPVDTGRGGGAPSSSEPLLHYEVWSALCNITGDCVAVPNGLVISTANALVNSTALSGLLGARRYVFFVRAVNRAGGGTFANVSQLTLEFPSAPQNFTAVVRPAYGPLHIFLSWGPPANTGQGLGSQVEPILGYRLYQDDPPGNFNSSSVILLLEGLNTTFIAQFPAERRAPYYFLVVAANALGYASNSTGAARASEQAVRLPSPPRNLTALVVGVRLIRLEWATPVDTGVGDESRALDAYEVQVSRDFNFSAGANATADLRARLVGPSLESLNETVPVAGPEFYFFRVYAINNAGRSFPSNVASEQGVSLPGSPAALSAAATAVGAVSLTWQSPLDTGINGTGRAILSYRLTASANGTIVQTIVVEGSVHNATFVGLDHFTVYFFAVFASNAAGESANSATVSFQPVALPTAPLSFAAAVSAPLQILLAWSEPADTGRGGRFEPIIAYLVEQDSNGPSFSNAVTIALGVSFCNSLGSCTLAVNFSAARKAAYWFRVRAKNFLGFGNSSISSEQSITVASAVPKFSAFVNHSFQIQLSWLEPVDTGVGDTSRPLQGYIVEQSFGNSNFTLPTIFKFLNSTFSNAINYNFTSSDYFYFRIFAINDAGMSNASYIIREQSINVPTAPIDFQVKLLGPLYMGLTWKIPNSTGTGDQSRALRDFALYIGQRSGLENNSESNTSFQDVIILPPNITALNKSGFQKGIVYFFEIRAGNDAGLGQFSSRVQVDALALPFPPLNFTAFVRYPFHINLSWALPVDTGFYQSDAGRLLGYFLQQSEQADFRNFSEVKIGSALVFSCTISAGLVKGKTYYFRLKTENVVGFSLLVNASEQCIDVPSTLAAEASISGPLQINVSWVQPVDTGLGIGIFPARPLRGYTLEIVVTPTPPNFPADFSTTNFTLFFSENVRFYLMQNLLKGQTYFARVRASNDAGLGNYSNIASCPAIDKPSAPTVFNIFANSFLLLYASWNVPSDTGLGLSVFPAWPLLTYRIQVAFDPGFLHSVRNYSFEGNITNGTIGNLSEGVLYYARVFAINSSSKEQLVGKPSPPRDFMALVSTKNEMELILTWLIPADTGLGGLPCFISCFGQVRSVNKFLIERIGFIDPPDVVNAKSPQRGTSTNIDFNGASQFYTQGYYENGSFSQNDSYLQKGITYYYRISALNSAGMSDPSNTSFEMAISKPSPAQNASIYITGDLKLTLKWLAPADNGNGIFAVYRRPLLYYLIQAENTSSNFKHILFQQEVSPDFDEVNFTHPILYPGSEYSFRIACVNAAGQGQFLDQGRSFSPGRYQQLMSNLTETAITVPYPPISLNLYISDPGELSFSWKPPIQTGAFGQSWPLLRYTVEMATNITFNNFVVIFDGRSLEGVDVNFVDLLTVSYTVVKDNLIGGVFYYFRVIAVNEAGNSLSSVTLDHIALYNPPAAVDLTAAVVGPLQINVSFSLPVLYFGENILRIILEMETVPDNFIQSSFISLCFDTRVPPCPLTGDSPYDLGILGSSGIIYSPACPAGISYNLRCTSWKHQEFSGIYSVLMTGLTKGQNYYFRVFLQNEAGLSEATQTVQEAAINVPSSPRNLVLELQSPLSFFLTWNVPLDTGNGSSTWPLTYYGVQMQAAQSVFQVSYSDADIMKYVPATMLTTFLTNDVGNVQILDGVRYFVCIFALNQAGRGGCSLFENNGPALVNIIPNSVPSQGGLRITLNGFRFGKIASDVQISIGQTNCQNVMFLTYQSSISCTAPPAISGRYRVIISVRNLTYLQENGFRYDAPIIYRLEPSLISIKGGNQVTVYGSNFGGMDSSPLAIIFPEHKGPQKCASTYWISDLQSKNLRPNLIIPWL